MRPERIIAGILLAATINVMASGPGPLWPGHLRAGQDLDWEALDRASLELEGVPMLEFLTELRPLAERLTSEHGARQFLSDHVHRLILGDHSTELALYNAWAEETSFQGGEDGVLRMAEFGGMNVSHRILTQMLQELLEGVEVSVDRISGVGRLVMDVGTERNSTVVTVDFDARTVHPELEVTNRFGGGRTVLVEDIERFIRWFTPLDELPSEVISIFVAMPDLPTIRHELAHALYASDPSFRERALSLARSLDYEGRELAILFAAISYDVFDPDMLDRNPEIVLDEALSAYEIEGRFDPSTGYSWFSIGDFLAAQGIELSLAEFQKIDDLPIPGETRELLAEMYLYFSGDGAEMTEHQFLQVHTRRVFDNLHCLAFLRELIIDQAPQLHARMVEARVALLDSLL